MPRLTYTPEGAEPKVWDFSFGRLLSPERIAIEKLTGLRWQAVKEGLFEEDTSVVHAFLWVFLKREIPTLRAEQVVFAGDEIDLDVTDDEAREARDALRARTAELSTDEAEALAELEERLGPDDEEPEDGGPKEG